MKIDFAASEKHFMDHLAPVYLALPEAIRGRFFIPRMDFNYAAKYNIAFDVYNSGLFKKCLTEEEGLIVCSAIGDIRKTLCGRPQVLMEHGAGQSYSGRQASYAGGAGPRENIVLCMFPNEMAAERHRKFSTIVPAEVIGCPKLDKWHKQPPKVRNNPPVVCISFHWNCLVCNETRSSWPEYMGVIAELSRSKEFKLIGHGHPRIINQLEPTFRRARVEIVSDFEEVIRRADVYVIDNSSTLFEFASLDRPVVVINSARYRRSAKHGLRFWDCSDVGVNCDSPAGIKRAILKAIEDPPEARARRLEVSNLVYPVRGNAAKRAAEILERLLDDLIKIGRVQDMKIQRVGLVKMTADRSFGVDPRIVKFEPGAIVKGVVIGRSGKAFWINANAAAAFEGRRLAHRVADVGPKEFKPVAPVENKVKVTTRPPVFVPVPVIEKEEPEEVEPEATEPILSGEEEMDRLKEIEKAEEVKEEEQKKRVYRCGSKEVIKAED